MSLRDRLLLNVTFLLIFIVLITVLATNYIVRRSLLAQAEVDGGVIAQLLSRSASFARRMPAQVETAIGEQMVVEATLAAHLVAVAEEAGLPAEEINAHLRQITQQSALDEFWITDENGHAYLRNIPEIDFTFSPDPQEQPQAHVFWALITGEKRVVEQEARRREVDDQVFKYVGVAGVDRPRIVQVGYNAGIVQELSGEVGLQRLTDDLVAGGDVIAIYVQDAQFAPLASSVIAGAPAGVEVGEAERALLQQAVDENQAAVEMDLAVQAPSDSLWEIAVQRVRTIGFLEGALLKVATPINDSSGERIGSALVYLPTDRVRVTLYQTFQLALVMAAFVLVYGLEATIVMSRRLTKPIARLKAAALEVEAGTFDPESLADMTRKKDELGKLAEVFTQMAREVRARQERLEQQVETLRIEIDEVRKQQQVQEITETDYFRDLQSKASHFRERGQRKRS
ncbi:MAG: HAMP domain-containing protein [Chloroflexota bacterium]